MAGFLGEGGTGKEVEQGTLLAEIQSGRRGEHFREMRGSRSPATRPFSAKAAAAAAITTVSGVEEGKEEGEACTTALWVRRVARGVRISARGHSDSRFTKIVSSTKLTHYSRKQNCLFSGST